MRRPARTSIAVGFAIAWLGIASACFYDWDRMSASADGGNDAAEDIRVADGGRDAIVDGDGSSTPDGPPELPDVVGLPCTLLAPGACGAATKTYCDFTDDQCGTGSNIVGVCRPAADQGSCKVAPPMVCSCEGITFPTECMAQSTGWDVSVLTSGPHGCGGQPGLYRCGYAYCTNASEVCLMADASRFACAELGGCGDCMCATKLCLELDDAGYFDASCTKIADGQMVINCP